MTKKLLLLAFYSLIVITGNAQLKRPGTTPIPARPQMQLFKPQAQMQEMQMRNPDTPVVQKFPNRANAVNAWYRRPAGAFSASLVVMDGAYAGMYYAPYIAMTPYVDYTFKGFADGVPDGTTYDWRVQYYGTNAAGEEAQIWETVPGIDLEMQYSYETDSVPIFKATVPSGTFYEFFIHGFEMSGTSDNPITGAEHSATVLAVPSTMDIWDIDILKSSKTFCYGGRNGNERYPLTYYSGAKPYGSNENGWWFGKNGGAKDGGFVDGIAQAFEKPTFPYLLKQVVVDCAVLEVKAPIDMYCKVYKLDEIPPYMDDDEAILPEVPGELIATGSATLTPETADVTGDLIFFTLFGEEDGLEYEITPTIDCAILVVVDGYNEPRMANLTDFSALISSDDMVDEGFGELAYLKYGVTDEEGNLEHYEWRGLNYFFSSGEMKTGLSIFLNTENPYLTFNYNAEDGEYLFPNEGGLMEKHFGNYTTRSIEFKAWSPSADDAWFISCNNEEVPDWLNIELTDEMNNGEFTNLVNAEVVAEPLPDGISYREAIVRFEFPGAYLDYKFMQGEKVDDLPNDTIYDNYLSLNDTEAFNGDTVTIPIAMTNEASIISFQTDIFLPEGLELIQEDGDYIIDPSDRVTRTHTMMSNDVSNGSIRVLCYSSNYKPFTGNSGDDLFYITVKVADDAEGDYGISLRNTLFTTSDFEEIVCPDVTANFHVNSYLLGDANGSGTVTVTDVVVTSQYVLEMNPQPFIFEAADVNADNNITVTDVTRIAWMVLNPSLNMPMRASAIYNNSDRMSGNDIILMPGETSTARILLDNEMDYSAFQFDLNLPAGLTATNFQLTDRTGNHASYVNALSNGKTRVLCYSPALEVINGHNGALLTFDVTANSAVEGVIDVDGIELVTSACQTVKLDGFAIGVNLVSSVNELYNGKSVVSIDYFNVIGQQIDQPKSGVTFVVTTYSDGTRSATKLLLKL